MSRASVPRLSASVSRRIYLALSLAVLIAIAVASAPVAALMRGSHASGTAPGGPGATSYLDVARKDCFGTARNRTSKVWFTVAHGVLSDVFSPNIESTNVKTVQYIVTDGKTFADLQERDMSYSLSSPDASGMVCRVKSIDRAHHFQLVSQYITDPARASVVVHTVLRPLSGSAQSVKNLKVYVRYDATIDNSGGGGSSNGGANDATIDPSTTALVASDSHPASGPFAAQVVGALAANRPFLAESSGFVGTHSDGLNQLDAHHRLVHLYRSATDGNVVQTARIDAKPGQPFSLALGFAPSAQRAIDAAQASAAAPFGATLSKYVRGWRAYDNRLHSPPSTLPGYSATQNAVMRRSYWLSANVIKSAEDKTHAGAFVASPTDPWGQSVPATTTHAGWTYREVFARDSYETFTGLLADGDRTSAREMVTFLFDHAQQADGSFPRNSEIDGAVAPDTFGLAEIDQDAYPVLMAWEAGFAGDASFYRRHIRPAADFIVDHGPNYGVERWEEHPGFSPSTLAAEIAGLVSASRLAGAAGDPARARLYLATADYYQRHAKQWTVTSTGPYAPHRYFLRLATTGHPNAPDTYDLGNGSLSKVDQRRVIDAGFLELTRLGELPPTDRDVRASLAVVDTVLGSRTASGPGWHRYGVKAKGSTDGYGDCYKPDPTKCSPTGAPWFPKAVGSGHPWPLLNGERAEHELQRGRGGSASALARDMRRMSWGLGMVPEQAWEDPNQAPSPYGSNPATASIGFFNGKAAGSAAPLIWGQAQYLRLLRDIHTGSLLDQPSITRSRYLDTGPPRVVPLTLTSPGAGSITTSATTVVAGSTTPGARVDVAAGRPNATNPTSVFTTVADSHGAFHMNVPTPLGATIISASATTGAHASGWAQVRVSHAYPSLSAAYDNVGITSDSDTSPGNFDGSGDSYSQQALASGTPHPLTPGGAVVVQGVAFTWPSVPAGQPDNVIAEGQAVALSGSGAKLGFLGAAALGTTTGTGTVTYTDATKQSFKLTFGDWAGSSPAPGTSVVNTTHRWNTTSGSNGTGGVRNVYFASVPLRSGKTVAFVTLPNISNGVGGVAAMHVFALGIGA